MSFAEKQASIGKTTVTSQASETPVLDDAADYVIYTVKYGDTLWDIAQKYPGVSDHDIKQLNNLSSANKIKPGQQLKIKPKN